VNPCEPICDPGANSPTIVTFNRGNYCPKDRRQLMNYATYLQPELPVNYCKLLTVTVEARLESIEMKAGIGAFWPFLSDHQRELLRALELADESEPRYSPVYPTGPTPKTGRLGGFDKRGQSLRPDPVRR
jgi:hypothetical protein